LNTHKQQLRTLGLQIIKGMHTPLHVPLLHLPLLHVPLRVRPAAGAAVTRSAAVRAVVADGQ
jgi:hypothetical protein